MRGVLGIVLVARVAAADDGVADLPQLARIEHGRSVVIVRGEVAKAKRKEAVALVDHVVADVQHRFTDAAGDARDTPDDPVTLALLGDEKRYVEVATALDKDLPSMWGFYLPSRRVSIANLGASIGNLRHELVHPLLGDDFPGIPAWLNEGIASLYGTARWDRDHFTFLVNYRLRDLQRAIRDGSLPTIDELAHSTDDDVRGDRAMVFYAMSRYVLLYVEKSGKLGELYASLRGAADTDAQAKILAHYVDDRSFVAWARKLRY